MGFLGGGWLLRNETTIERLAGCVGYMIGLAISVALLGSVMMAGVIAGGYTERMVEGAAYDWGLGSYSEVLQLVAGIKVAALVVLCLLWLLRRGFALLKSLL